MSMEYVKKGGGGFYKKAAYMTLTKYRECVVKSSRITHDFYATLFFNIDCDGRVKYSIII